MLCIIIISVRFLSFLSTRIPDSNVENSCWYRFEDNFERVNSTRVIQNGQFGAGNLEQTLWNRRSYLKNIM